MKKSLLIFPILSVALASCSFSYRPPVYVKAEATSSVSSSSSSTISTSSYPHNEPLVFSSPSAYSEIFYNAVYGSNPDSWITSAYTWNFVNGVSSYYVFRYYVNSQTLVWETSPHVNNVIYGYQLSYMVDSEAFDENDPWFFIYFGLQSYTDATHYVFDIGVVNPITDSQLNTNFYFYSSQNSQIGYSNSTLYGGIGFVQTGLSWGSPYYYGLHSVSSNLGTKTFNTSYTQNAVSNSNTTYRFNVTTSGNLLLPRYFGLYGSISEASYKNGYSNGWNDGNQYATTNGGVWNLFSGFFTAIGGFLNINILPGISVGVIIAVPVLLGLLVIMISILKKG